MLSICMIKSFIQKFFLKFNYKVINLKKDKSNLDQFLNELIKFDNPLIFDVGANVGQSVKILKKIFPNSLIHCFEPDNNAYKILFKNYSNNKTVKLNPFGLGKKNEYLEFNSYIETGKSSFYKLNLDTEFIKYKANVWGVDQNEYLDSTYQKEIKTIDNYCEQNNIKKIDFLKIDTQGYEENVINGANNMIKNNLIDVIRLELIFSSVYQKNLNIYDIEKILIPNGYKLFGTSQYGNLLTDQNWQCDFMYISNSIYEKIKINPKFKSFKIKKSDA